MPDGRMVSKVISTDEELAACSLKADFLYGRCIPHLDREGRMTGNPKLVRAAAIPLREDIGEAEIADLLAELARADLVQWYEVDSRRVLFFPGFRKHNRGAKLEREAASRFPAPDDGQAKSALAHEQRMSSAGPAEDEVGLREVKGSEVEVEVEELHTGPRPDVETLTSDLSERMRA